MRKTNLPKKRARMLFDLILLVLKNFGTGIPTFVYHYMYLAP